MLVRLRMYLAMDWPVFPCRASPPNEKGPLTVHGFKDASLDPDVIGKWAEQNPDCAWGTPTSSDRAAVDVDPRHGGHETWEALLKVCPFILAASGLGGEDGWRGGPVAARGHRVQEII
jgi:hypothetical protein